MLIAVGLLLILALTLATGYFVAQEFAYVATDRDKLRRLADSGDAAARRALKITGRLSFALSGAQLGITITTLLVGYVAEPYLGEGIALLLGGAGVPVAVSLPLSVALALLVATVIQMVFGELAPKNLAIARAESLARALSRSTVAYLAVFGPLIRVFDLAAARLLRRIGIEPVEELPSGATPEDLAGIFAASREGGQLDEGTSVLLHRGLRFRRRTAAEVMVPRVDVHTIAADDPIARVVDLLVTGRSRFPVRGRGGVDDVTGVVGIADVLEVPPARRADTPVSAVAAPALLVPETLRVPEVLDRMRRAHRQLACVVDEYGGFAGVITLEDIAEELVGPIRDEDDLPEPAARRRDDGSWVVPGRWRIDEVADATGIALPTGAQYDTVSGLVLRGLGRLPRPGDRVEVDVAGTATVVEVLTVDRHVPGTVLVTRGGGR